jgi:predicted HTH transcriptional regulator
MAIDWTQIITADDLAVLGEDFRLEAKAAQGRDGRGALPQSALETYSAFANTSGGVILLGVEEQDDGTLHLCGLGDAGKVRRELWDALHNSQRVHDI